MAAFVADDSPDAWPRLVDRLLASPQYGERWGRHWLDVARYSDTKGYTFTEDRRFPYAYVYRDWVIRALNDDLPYDQFLTQQLAADCLPTGEDKSSLAALGYLTLGRRFLNNAQDIIDDRIDVMCRGMLGLTVSCARCHDHKYDPIPTADYYSLYGVFASCEDQLLPIEEPKPDFARELDRRQATVQRYLDEQRNVVTALSRRQASDYLLASYEARSGEQAYRLVAQPQKINRAILERWRHYLEKAEQGFHPIFGPWLALSKLPADNFAEQARQLLAGYTSDATADPQRPRVNRHVLAALAATPPSNLVEAAKRYGALLDDAEQAWQLALGMTEENGVPPPTALEDADLESLRQVLFGAGMPGDLASLETRRLLDQGQQMERAKLEAQIADWRSNRRAPRCATALVDRSTPVEPYVFQRGNPGRRGENVPRQFLACLAGEARRPFEHGSGRLELARAIVDPANPLTARVMVNRVWALHFGAGLVRTPSDFGLRSDPPTHADLLDYLAARFMESGWSIKWLHRQIMLSDVYRQASNDRPDARLIDSDNRLLWRANRQRLSWEALHDSLLAVAGTLDLTPGGRAVELLSDPFARRRAVYGLVDRQNLSGTARSL